MAEINVRGRIHQPFLETGDSRVCCVPSTCVQREIDVLFSWLIGKLPRLRAVYVCGGVSMLSHLELNLCHSVLCQCQIIRLRVSSLPPFLS